jgi:hypothetical protein
MERKVRHPILNVSRVPTVTVLDVLMHPRRDVIWEPLIELVEILGNDKAVFA